MNDHHPTDSAIAASITGDAHDQAIVQHLASCAQCRSIAARLGDDPLDDLPDVPLPNDSAVVPSATAVAAADARPVDLAVDQIWRAAAPGGSMVLCWIRRLRSDGRPAVVPVSSPVAWPPASSRAARRAARSSFCGASEKRRAVSGSRRAAARANIIVAFGGVQHEELRAAGEELSLASLRELCRQRHLCPRRCP